MTNLSCTEFTELISDFLDGAVTPATEATVAEHIAECRDCAHSLDQLRRTVAMLRTTPAEPLPGHLEQRLLAAFREWRDSRDPG